MRRTLRFAALALVLGLGGCLRPLYGSPDLGGLAVQNGLAGIKIEVAGERLAHYLRNELEFGLRGGDPDAVAASTTHRLVITASQTTQSAIVDRVTGAAENAVISINARYLLYPIGKTVAVTEGDARVLVSYERSQQRFASIRAARDAEIQAARQLADQIRTRVAAFLATNR